MLFRSKKNRPLSEFTGPVFRSGDLAIEAGNFSEAGHRQRKMNGRPGLFPLGVSAIAERCPGHFLAGSANKSFPGVM